MSIHSEAWIDNYGRRNEIIICEGEARLRTLANLDLGLSKRLIINGKKILLLADVLSRLEYNSVSSSITELSIRNVQFTPNDAAAFCAMISKNITIRRLQMFSVAFDNQYLGDALIANKGLKHVTLGDFYILLTTKKEETAQKRNTTLEILDVREMVLTIRFLRRFGALVDLKIGIVYGGGLFYDAEKFIADVAPRLKYISIKHVNWGEDGLLKWADAVAKNKICARRLNLSYSIGMGRREVIEAFLKALETNVYLEYFALKCTDLKINGTMGDLSHVIGESLWRKNYTLLHARIASDIDLYETKICERNRLIWPHLALLDRSAVDLTMALQQYRLPPYVLLELLFCVVSLNCKDHWARPDFLYLSPNRKLPTVSDLKNVMWRRGRDVKRLITIVQYVQKSMR